MNPASPFFSYSPIDTRLPLFGNAIDCGLYCKQHYMSTNLVGRSSRLQLCLTGPLNAVCLPTSTCAVSLKSTVVGALKLSFFTNYVHGLAVRKN